MRKRACAVVVLFGLSGSRAAVAEPAVLTLTEAVSLALSGSRTVRTATLEVERSEQRLAAARDRRRPVFYADAGTLYLLSPLEFRIDAGELGTYPSTGPLPGRDTRLTTPNQFVAYVAGAVAQPLTQLHRIGLGVRVAELESEIVRERLRSERMSVLNEVKRVYRSLVSTAAQLQAARDSVRVHREMDRTVTGHVAAETAMPGDALSVHARLAAEELRVLKLENTAATEKERLNQLLGRELTADFAVEPLPGPGLDELDLEAAREHALRNRPEIRQARLRAEQADYDRRMKQAEQLPDVSVGVSYISFFNFQFLPRNVAAAGMRLTWEPFDWGRRGREVAEKARGVDQARTAAAEAAARIQVEVGALFRRLAEARATVRVADLSRDAARESARVARLRMGADAILLKDALAAEASVAEAEARYQESLLGYWTVRGEMDRALGEEGLM